MKNEEVLQAVREEGKVLPTVRRRLTGFGTFCVGTTLKSRYCRKTEGKGRRERRRKHLPVGLKEKRRYSKLKEEGLGSTLLRTWFGRVYRSILKNTFLYGRPRVLLRKK